MKLKLKKPKEKPITLEVILQNERLKRGWNYKHLAEQLALPNITAKNVKKWEYSFVVKMALEFLAGFVAVVLKTDYSIWGILLIAIFYMQRNDRRNALLYTCFLMFVQGRMQSFGVLAIPFIMAYDDTKYVVKMP